MRAACLALMLSACAAPPKPQLEYTMPAFDVKLNGANFEYVERGVVVVVDIADRVEKMGTTFEAGLVNEALKQIYARVPEGGAIALVNVVVEVSRRKTVTDGPLSRKHVDEHDDQLVVRADIVRFEDAK